MFDRSPKLSLCNAAGISNEDVSELQNELRRMAADLVGEVRCTYVCLDWTALLSIIIKFLNPLGEKYYCSEVESLLVRTVCNLLVIISTDSCAKSWESPGHQCM